jgi:flagellar motor protein MotB
MTTQRLLAPLLLSTAFGCALPPPVDGTAAPPASAGAHEQLATMKTYQYLRIDPEKTGVANAADDGRYTYVAFNRPVSDDTAFFDAEGNPITVARQGRVAALPGVYKGFLIRIGLFNSFVAPNPRASAADRPNLEADPEVVEARNRLEVAATHLPAFRRAMQLADAAQRQAPDSGASPAPVPSSREGAQAYIVPPLPPLKPIAAGDPTYVRLPNGVMVRIFFAAGGRAIVRPDDGLQRLESEASDASEVRISGYADAIGSEAANASLARSRAEAIRALLLKRGVPADKIFLTWTGNGRYLADNETERGRALNRRVEVVFVKPPRERAAMSSQ